MTKTLSITEFKDHCTEALRTVETKKNILRITRHGKPVAIVSPPVKMPRGKPLGDWLGSGKDVMKLAPDYAPHEPAVGPGEWEALQDEAPCKP